MWNKSFFMTIIINYIPDKSLVDFIDYMEQYNKSYYNHYEFNKAYNNFVDNNDIVDNLNYKKEMQLISSDITNISNLYINISDKNATKNAIKNSNNSSSNKLKFTINEFADLDIDEFNSYYKGFIIDKDKTTACSNFESYDNNLNESLDWRDFQIVTQKIKVIVEVVGVFQQLVLWKVRGLFILET